MQRLLTSLLPPSASCFLISSLHSSSAGGSFQTKMEHILSFLKTLQWLAISIKFKFLMRSTKPCVILPLVLFRCPALQLRTLLTLPFWPLFPKNAKPSQDFGTYCRLSQIRSFLPWICTWLIPWCYLGLCSNITSLELSLNITDQHCAEPLHLLTQHLMLTYFVSFFVSPNWHAKSMTQLLFSRLYA